MAGHRDAQSHALCKLNQNNCKQNSPWDPLNVGGTRCFEQAMDWCLWRRGSINLYHSVWELPIMHVVWKIQPSHSCCVDSESIPLKMLFISILNRALAPLQIPASLCEGPIYLLLCWVITLLIKKHPLESTLSFAFIIIGLYWVWLDWISFTMNYNV